MDCDRVHSLLSEFLDRTLAPGDQDAVAAHLETCAACRALLLDLGRVRTAARALGPIAPPAGLGPRVAGAVAHAGEGGSARPQASPPAWRQWVGIAAALLVTTLVVWLAGRITAPAPDPGNAPPVASVEGVAEELRLAMEHYERAIATLEGLAKADDGDLDPALAATLTASLRRVDEAIAESRLALATSPESAPARESLFEALRRKVGVLQATATLINEMRQGDPDAARQAAAALGKKG